MTAESARPTDRQYVAAWIRAIPFFRGAHALPARRWRVRGPLVAARMTNEEIADRPFIRLATVKRHILNAYGKLGVSHRTEAIARANELDLLQDFDSG